ncbi:MAG: MFS transporter [Dehalococcoidia bacterium]|nr:MFS transporter [Dehalococcoidia bacterium]
MREAPSRGRFGVLGTTLSIAAGVGIASLSTYFWIPFLPLYAKELGARNEANAVFWVAVGSTTLGLGRVISGPAWGLAADRFGRKLMFVRALFFASITTLILIFAREPWHIAVAFACQGLFSGYIPAAVALTTVSVPDTQMSRSLGIVNGAQYLGSTVGPAIGAGLAVLFDYRGAIIAASIMPALAALVVLWVVPPDGVRRTATVETASVDAKGRPLWRTLSAQFYLAIFLYFLIFALNQLVRLLTPIALQDITGHEDVAGSTGLAFTLGGVASVAGVALVGQGFVGTGRLRTSLIIGSAVAGVAHLLLAGAQGVPMFVVGFSLISLVQAMMLPATNTLIATNVPRDRRGTGFGLAGSAQAAAFLVGPMGAAGFAAVSLALGFVVIGVLFGALALLLLATLREPTIED